MDPFRNRTHRKVPTDIICGAAAALCFSKSACFVNSLYLLLLLCMTNSGLVWGNGFEDCALLNSAAVVAAWANKRFQRPWWHFMSGPRQSGRSPSNPSRKAIARGEPPSGLVGVRWGENMRWRATTTVNSYRSIEAAMLDRKEMIVICFDLSCLPSWAVLFSTAVIGTIRRA